MWRRSLSAGYRCFGCRSVGPKGIWGSHAVRTCSAPALPAGRITALQAVDLWRRHFEERGVTEPDHSSQYIIAHLLGAKTIESLEQGKLTEFLSQEKTEQVWKLCSRRLSRMPVQYVIEEWDFRDLTLKMRPPVFIPRPETEELVELVLADLETEPRTGVGAGAQHTCLEVGCGSGAISLSLLKSLPQLKASAVDQSQDAVDLTRENALRLGLQDRLQIYHIDVMKDADAVLSLCSHVSALVSNPPYLFSEDMTTLEPEILSRVYLEVDPRHPPLIRRWVEVNVEEMHYVETRHDISGRPRFCILQKEESHKHHKLDLD
ncbi:MTRF1L release factor glutamine methyltransferase isoform X3 [Epinephelus moara]|uniref:MTRF1L release factor glutamine methyltransferase isoform X3 n=1 Tax=Epinephelus moara TaxID=300413 RepID=UPI00214F5B5B|nr:MTRF1L release factor glutamine methyltransferase isoform X3 [Epinephelus moara]